MTRAIFAGLSLLVAVSVAALAQTPVTVIGGVTVGHCVKFFSTTQIKDSGTVSCITSSSDLPPIPSQTVLGNSSGVTAPPLPVPFSGLLLPITSQTALGNSSGVTTTPTAVPFLTIASTLRGQINTWTADNYFGSGRPWCDVRAKGALGNGSADDTAAINSCITTLSGGGVLYLPPGNYKITSTITVGTQGILFKGAGYQASQITTSGDFTALIFNASGGHGGIDNLWVIGFQDAAATTNTVRVTSGVPVYFSNCRIWGGLFALETAGVDGALYNCYVMGSASAGGGITSTGANFYDRAKIDSAGFAVTVGFRQNTAAFQAENFFINSDFSATFSAASVQIQDGNNAAVTGFVNSTFSHAISITGARETRLVSSELGGSVTTSASLTATSNMAFSGVTISGSGAITCAANDANVTCPTVTTAFGFDTCVNMQLNATVSGNALTIALKANNGSDPTVSNPVLCPFHDTTETSGDPVWVSTTAATSFATGTSGSSFGSTNSVPARFWIVGFNNAGTLALGLVNASTATQIFPLNEGVLTSTTACNACTTANAAGTFYTTSALSSKAFRILGYFEATETTAGTWASAPTRIKLFGPGVRKPGDVIQKIYFTTTSTSSTTSSTFSASNISASITPTSNVNLVQVKAECIAAANAGASLFATLRRGTSTNIGLAVDIINGLASIVSPFYALDAPATSSATTYAVYISSSNNTNIVTCPASSFGNPIGSMLLEEIMG